MSTINSKNVQVGTSGTATDNFTLYQPAAPDGTVRLGVGNSGATTSDVVTVNSSGMTVTGTIAASGNMSFNSGYGSAAVAYGCRAWVNFNGSGTVEIRASANVSSITDNGTGTYTINFTTAMPDANYSASGIVGVLPGATAGFTGVFDSSAVPTTSALRVYAVNASNALADYARIFYAIFR